MKLEATSMTMRFLLPFLVSLAKSASAELPPFMNGVNTLCIGHSFFVPVARTMDELVDTTIYPDHGFQEVFRGGEKGSPQSLWITDKDTVENILQDGDIDLLMMTVHEGTTVDDYAKWIDLARSYNLNTAFYIGIPWPPNGPEKTTVAYNAEIEETTELTFSMIEELRSLYVGSPIYYLSYGYTAARMRTLFDENALQDIDNLCCERETDIYRDEAPAVGHQGDMLKHVAALLWLRLLYNDTSVTSLLSYNQNDVDDIIGYATDKNSGKWNNQVLMPTIAPAPTTAPMPNNNGWRQCFSGDSHAIIQGKGRVPMSQVRVGDKVLTGSGHYQTVYAHGHRHETKPVEYLQIRTTLLGTQNEQQHQQHEKEIHAIELTKDHMIFVGGKSHPVPASRVRVGDSVRTSKGDYATVNKVSHVVRNGYYNPLTPDGTIVVDGIVASIYPTLWGLGSQEFVELAGYQLSFFPIHTAIDMAIAPYRTYRQMSMTILSFLFGANNNNNQEPGDLEIPACLHWAISIYECYLKLHEEGFSVLQLCMFIICGTFIGFFYLLLQPFMIAALAAVLGHAIYTRRHMGNNNAIETKPSKLFFVKDNNWLLFSTVLSKGIHDRFSFAQE